MDLPQLIKKTEKICKSSSLDFLKFSVFFNQIRLV